MQVRVKKLDPKAKVPTRATAGSVGYDLYALHKTAVYDHPVIVPTGIAIEVPDGYEAQVRGRSSLEKSGVSVRLGTIDSDYRGEIGVIMASRFPFDVSAGDRIAQLVIAPIVTPDLIEADELGYTARGAMGFGSTGRR